MKRRDIQELKQKPLEELARLLKGNQEQLRVLRFDLEAGKVKNIKSIKDLRRTVARIKTFIRLLHHGDKI